jgi:hypothetical protein
MGWAANACAFITMIIIRIRLYHPFVSHYPLNVFGARDASLADKPDYFMFYTL